ncbi:hypothetical protein VTJ04DRAFT_8875 [Mycothermus thermophilus]|uniref:uncharacterized protein n=1 Tax=Humicola insolens TaxID=85995 RepID=UPI003741EF24
MAEKRRSSGWIPDRAQDTVIVSRYLHRDGWMERIRQGTAIEIQGTKRTRPVVPQKGKTAFLLEIKDYGPLNTLGHIMLPPPAS